MSQQLVWFAIQRKSTRRLLPAPPARQRAGQTHVSFESPGPPRLFPTAAGANVAMKLWLRGGVMGYKDFTYDPKLGRSKGRARYGDTRMHLTGDVHVIPVCVQIIENTDLQLQPIPSDVFDEDDIV